MKKGLIFLTLFVVLCLFAACRDKEESSSGESSFISSSSSAGESSADETSYNGISSQTEESSEFSTEESSEASAEESSQVSSEESSKTPEESSQPAEESSDEPAEKIGSYAKPYMDIIKTGKYYIKTTESRLVGGEAPPYITEMYADGGIYYTIITESYGAESILLIKDNSIYWLDTAAKTASVTPYDKDLFNPERLWSGNITLIKSGIESVSYDGNQTEYNYETYKDSKGLEFTLLFNGQYLLKYRSYDTQQGDNITIDIKIKSEISAGVFQLPQGYTVY